jgi:hypothetical protein
MSQLNPLKNASDPDNIYYDIQIANLASASTPPPVLYFNEIRNSPFVSNPQEYVFSIVRFTLDTPTLPVFIPEIATLPNNPSRNINQTIYSFTYQYNGFSKQYFISWTPQDKSANVPEGFTQYGLQNNSSGYYNCYTYEFWISLINQAFLSAFEDFKTSYSGSPAFPTGYTAPNGNMIAPPVAPQMAWDSSAMVARIVFDEFYLTSKTTPIYLYLNSPLYNLFSSLNALFYGYNSSGLNWLINVDQFANFNTYTTTTIDASMNTIYQNFTEVVQEWGTTTLMSPISSLVFVSNTLPIISNQLSKPLIYNEGNILSNYGNNSNFQQIITDIVANDGLYKPNLVYLPQAQYRYVSLTGNYPLFSVDISVFWKDKIGQLQQFYLGSGCTASLKILFTKKNSKV